MKQIVKLLNKSIKESQKHVNRFEREALKNDCMERDDEGDYEFEKGFLASLEHIKREIEKINFTPKIQKAVNEFVRTNYGQSEVSSPSWNIKLLARYIACSI